MRLAFILMGLLAACTRPASPPAEVPRLVSLAPAMTATIGALEATDQLVGRSDWCTEPAGVEALPAMGSSLTPNLEALANLRPTRIITQRLPGGGDASLDAVAPVSRLPWLSLDDVQASTLALGELVDAEPAARALADRFGTELASQRTDASPSVLAIIGSDGPAGEIFYVRSDSLHGAVIEAAGGRNAMADAPSGAPTLTAERVVALDPEVILILDARDLPPAEEAAAVARWKALSPVRAVVDDRIVVLDGAGLLSVGPGILDVVPQFRRAIAGKETGSGY